MPQGASLMQKNYSQMDIECLAVTFACDLRRLYLLGRSFTLYNDHEALVTILQHPKAKVPLRIKRLTLRL